MKRPESIRRTQATLEGSMTGGQMQIDAEVRLANDSHVRLESMLRKTTTEACREQVISAYQNYVGAQLLVSPES